LLRWSTSLAIVAAAIWVAFRVTSQPSFASALSGYRWALVATPLAAVVHFFTTWQLSDSVFDCGDHLLVRRGRRTLKVPLARISSIGLGLHLLGNLTREVVLSSTSETGARSEIRFLPAHTGLSAGYARVGVLSHLRLRVERARNAA